MMMKQCFLYSDHNDLMSRKKQAHALSEEHDERLEKVLSAIEKAGLTLNEKCEF
jgi:hypothetical protein